MASRFGSKGTMAKAAQHSSRNRSNGWISKVMKLVSICGAPWPSGLTSYANHQKQIALAEKSPDTSGTLHCS